MLIASVTGCRRKPEFERKPPAAVSVATVTSVPSSAPPAVLYVPDVEASAEWGPPPPRVVFSSNCPPDMVSVRGQYCIDRFEASLVDSKLSRPLSPFYHPTQSQTRTTFQLWESLRFTMGEPQYQILPIPAPPSFQLTEAFSVKAVSVRDTVPAGYLNGYLAEEACKNAGKRLCNEEEWVVACRGERNLNFPYGDQFEPDRCNVNNGRHPARILHGHAGKGHLDPRLNAFAYDGQPLLHATGRSPDCVSRWGDDGAWDMVGNIDEWVDDADGTFVGGFYARNTQAGCAARITVHPRAYFDYSLGVRCCR